MEEMKYAKQGTCIVLHKGKHKNYNFAIVSYGTHPCCYVFLPKKHKFYGKDYDNIDICCHGGLTFSENDLCFNPLPNDEWIIGWDYAHCEDYSGHFEDNEYLSKNTKKWTTEELFEEVKEVIEQL